LSATIDSNAAARDAILGRVRKALGKSEDRGGAASAAAAYVHAHQQGPQPDVPGEVVGRFMMRARDMASTVDRVARVQDVPAAVARYLDGLKLPAAAARNGVCWPEFGDLDWRGAGLAMEARPTEGNDSLGVTGSYCAIAETGTIVLLSGAETPTATALLPETYVAIVRADRVVRNMEAMFALLRAEHPRIPRAINMISGPSRTGDIEQTIVLGAHGPYRMHVIVVG
jgi:L-lactate dehydrogenase complex protein LldG